MNRSRIDGDALLELAIETLRAGLQPALPPDKRYAAAMIGNALEIARRDMTHSTDEAMWALLDPIYGEGEGSLRQLAQDIRAGTVNDEKQEDLRARLLAYTVAELKVRNPRHLATRGVTA